MHPEGPVTLDWARGFLVGGSASTETGAGEAHHERFASFRKPAEAARAAAPPAFEALDRAGLFGALDVFAKNWLAHDGSWFLAAEERFGMDAAMELDAAAWRRFAAAEARRIMEAYAIPKDGGLDALARALSFRAYSFVNPSRDRAGRRRPALLHDVLPRPGDAPAQGPARTFRAGPSARSSSRRSRAPSTRASRPAASHARRTPMRRGIAAGSSVSTERPPEDSRTNGVIVKELLGTDEGTAGPVDSSSIVSAPDGLVAESRLQEFAPARAFPRPELLVDAPVLLGNG